MTITRKSLADTVDSYDDEIAALQASKRETFQSYREQLSAVMGKDDVKVEIEATKAAIKRRRAIREKDALTDEIFYEITAARAPRATRVEIIDEFDPETGEFRTPVSHAPAQPGGLNPDTTDGAASAGETANMQDGSEPTEVHTLGPAGSTPAPATNFEPQAEMPAQTVPAATPAPEVSAEQASVESSAHHSNPVTVPPSRPEEVTETSGRDSSVDARAVPAVQARPDYTKPNPWCVVPDDCGVEASWNHMCGACLRRRDAKRHEAEAVH